MEREYPDNEQLRGPGLEGGIIIPDSISEFDWIPITLFPFCFVLLSVNPSPNGNAWFPFPSQQSRRITVFAGRIQTEKSFKILRTINLLHNPSHRSEGHEYYLFFMHPVYRSSNVQKNPFHTFRVWLMAKATCSMQCLFL